MFEARCLHPIGYMRNILIWAFDGWYGCALASEEPPQWHDFITSSLEFGEKWFPIRGAQRLTPSDKGSSQTKTIVNKINMKINKILFLSLYFQVSVPSDFQYHWRIVAICWHIIYRISPMFVRCTVQWVKFCVREQKNNYFIYHLLFRSNEMSAHD